MDALVAAEANQIRRKRLLTARPVTGVGPVPGMGALVHGERTRYGKSHVTARPVTGVGLIPGMGALVFGEITRYGKRSCDSPASHRRRACLRYDCACVG